MSAPLSARLGEPKVRGEDVTIEVPAEWLLGREEEQEDGAAAAADNNSEKESRTQKRGTATQRFRHAVVHDDWPSYTARELCEDPTADGPNFVNPDEGLFCKMTTRTLYPVCDATTTTKQNVAVGNVRGDLGCYDIQPAQLGESLLLTRFSPPSPPFRVDGKTSNWLMQSTLRDLTASSSARRLTRSSTGRRTGRSR